MASTPINSPSMATDHIDVRYVAGLAQLQLSDEECATFQPQLEAVLEHIDKLTELDVENIEPTAHPSPVLDVMRPDTPHRSLDANAVLQNAPDHTQGQIRVPKVIADA